MTAERPRSVPLGELVTLQRGTTYRSSLLDRPGPILLGLASILPDGGFRSNSLRTYGGESPEKLILGPGDLYVSLKDVTQSGDLLGAVSRVPREVVRGRLTQDTVKLVFKRREVRRDYVYWLLRTPQYRDYCRARAIGTTNLSLTRKDFLAFPVPTPTPRQIGLVEVLEALEAKIELNRGMNETLEALAATRFRGSFLGSAGQDWPEARLGEHVVLARGLSYTGDGLSDDGIPMHNLNSIYEGGGYKYEGIKFYRGDYEERHKIVPGDLIVANTEQGHDRLLIGYPAIVPKRFGSWGLFSHHLYRVRPRSGSPLTSSFLCLLLRSTRMHDLVAGHANGTTVNMLPMDGLQRPWFRLPSTDLLAGFEEAVSPLFELQQRLFDQSETLAALRDTLLPTLLSGEIPVKDSEGLAAG